MELTPVPRNRECCSKTVSRDIVGLCCQSKLVNKRPRRESITSDKEIYNYLFVWIEKVQDDIFYYRMVKFIDTSAKLIILF